MICQSLLEKIDQAAQREIADVAFDARHINEENQVRQSSFRILFRSIYAMEG